ncbi:MoaD/ThiS family protein [Gordonia paraffinivorans]|uniref:Molybdopterin synthase small subunit MoaD n=2 Tax=Gordonia paraffinivorans TaxID=175628 RepID=A0ABQ0IQC7_9ACTN|nr:MoaD/ThiS family protein [Gordonia paraffinivorans]MBY4572958.1 molybdopterin synthase sulfur carrier subunit [Gordonia paraffinivorans]MCD2147316.1 MoaD/ThiS family protein [Gordonia paraffinivorans]PWD43219.1 molybdopterin synthase sulfur carrier subunit [Gordonia paraffinivorans]VFA89936.1 molybdopterin converting factor, subunit 1 [Gordonia paraffinivorans]GAC85753.1 molybdopterin synthase small subunit MoaD [Gordonia paraffinivorans NBRC 108238]
MQLTVRFFAAARAAAGTDETVVDVATSTTLGELETQLARGNDELRKVLDRCSYLRDEIALTDRSQQLGTCTTLDVLPPFAGG